MLQSMKGYIVYYLLVVVSVKEKRLVAKTGVYLVAKTGVYFRGQFNLKNVFNLMGKRNVSRHFVAFWKLLSLY